jgi:sugar fermentation stimulation protein A
MDRRWRGHIGEGAAVELPLGLREATFVSRANRFVAVTRLGGAETPAHLANSGRLRELLRPGIRVMLAPAAGAHRRTAYDLLLVEARGVLVSTDARLPNHLLAEAIDAGRLPELAGYAHLRREVPFQGSRLDFLLSGERGRLYLEAKSVTLVEGGTALFPDAPTERGRKHLAALVSAVEQGHRAAAAFVIQRPDARELVPNEAADPLFCDALREAARRGVETYAYRCRVSRREIEIAGSVPVRL